MNNSLLSLRAMEGMNCIRAMVIRYLQRFEVSAQEKGTKNGRTEEAGVEKKKYIGELAPCTILV